MHDGLVALFFVDGLERTLIAEEHLETLADILQSDACALVILRTERMTLRDGVLGGEEQAGSILTQSDMDPGTWIVDDAGVLEAVLDHGLQDHRWNHIVRIGDLTLEGQIGLTLHTDSLEVNVVTDVLHFFLQKHLFCAAVVNHIAEHLGELQHRIGGLLILSHSEGIDTVERVEEEVRIDLRTQVLQSVLHLLLLELLIELITLINQERHTGHNRCTEQQEGVFGVEKNLFARIVEDMADQTFFHIHIEILTEEGIGERIQMGSQRHQTGNCQKGAEEEETSAAMDQLGQDLIVHQHPQHQHRQHRTGRGGNGHRQLQMADRHQDKHQIERHPDQSFPMLLRKRQETGS